MKTTKTNMMMAVMMAAALPFTAQALTIGFETGEGYSVGNLAGQPSSGTQWAMVNGNTNIISVADSIGVGGSRGIVGSGTGGGSNFVFYGFNTTNADLGFTFDSASSVLDYSFDWRPTQALDGAVGTEIFRFAIGSDEVAAGNAALNLTIRASGRLIALDAGTNRAVDGLFTLNEYATISGQVNYAANTFTVFVNDTQQFTSNNSGNLGFVNTASDNAFIRIGNLQGANADYRTWNADNISIIPEPSTLALLGIALGAVAMFRRRK